MSGRGTPGRVAVGDIVSIEPVGDDEPSGRLVAVLGLDDGRGTAHVVLVDTDDAYAADRDVRFRPYELGTPLRLLIETDVLATVWQDQLGGRIGRLGDFAPAASAATFRNAWPDDLAERTGPPFRGQSDPRWQHKLAEAALLHELASDCVRAIAGIRASPTRPVQLRHPVDLFVAQIGALWASLRGEEVPVGVLGKGAALERVWRGRWTLDGRQVGAAMLPFEEQDGSVRLEVHVAIGLQPISNGEVRVEVNGRPVSKAATDADGRADLRLPPGTLTDSDTEFRVLLVLPSWGGTAQASGSGRPER